MITHHDLPFTLPTWQEFHDLLYAIQPEAAALLPQSSATVQGWIIKTYLDEKNIIRICLQEALSDIHITLDLWTFPNHLALLGVVAHFTDKNGQLNQALIAMDEVDGAHSGENICETFLHIANEYEIRHKLGYFMMDNVSNNDTFLEFISKEHNLGLEYDPEERRLRCNGHVINLSVQSFLFGNSENALQDTGVNPATIETEMDEWRKLGPLGKAHNIAVYSRLNPQRIKRF